MGDLPKIGQQIVIRTTPTKWASLLDGESPLRLKYPIIGTVIDTKSANWYTCMNVEINGTVYGFSIEHTDFYDLYENFNNLLNKYYEDDLSL